VAALDPRCLARVSSLQPLSHSRGNRSFVSLIAPAIVPRVFRIRRSVGHFRAGRPNQLAARIDSDFSLRVQTGGRRLSAFRALETPFNKTREPLIGPALLGDSPGNVFEDHFCAAPAGHVHPRDGVLSGSRYL
jgi:hypothetical protein